MADRPDVEWQYPSLDLKHSLRHEEVCGGEPPVQVPGFTADPASGGLSDFDMLTLSLLGFEAPLGGVARLPLEHDGPRIGGCVSFVVNGEELIRRDEGEANR